MVKILYFFARLYWKMFRPVTFGVKVIAEQEGKIALVLPKYAQNWHLPGGGVKKGETPLAAAARELLEECGVAATQYTLDGLYTNFSEGKSDHIAVFSAHLEENTLVPRHEIKDCRLFSPSDLPNVSPGSLRRIEEFRAGTFAGGKW